MMGLHIYYHTTWASWCFKSPATLLLNSFPRLTKKERSSLKMPVLFQLMYSHRNSQHWLLHKMMIKFVTWYDPCLASYIWHPLQWHHNGCNGISNHQPHKCLLNLYSRHRSKKTSKLCVTGLCTGNSLVTGNFLRRWELFEEEFYLPSFFRPSLTNWWYDFQWMALLHFMCIFDNETSWHDQTLWLVKVLTCTCIVTSWSGHLQSK